MHFSYTILIYFDYTNYTKHTWNQNQEHKASRKTYFKNRSEKRSKLFLEMLTKVFDAFPETRYFLDNNLKETSVDQVFSVCLVLLSISYLWLSAPKMF